MAEMKILLVEDNPDDELLILRELRRQNVVNKIAVVRDGVEALDYLFGEGDHAERDANDCPTLMILDLKLPKLDGLEVLRRVRVDARTKLMPIVVMTSSDEEKDIVVSYSLGANGYVRKPVDFDEFREAVRHLHLYWVLTNEAPPSRS